MQDVDLLRQAISVQHTLVEINGRNELAEPKTATGRRRVNLPEIAVRALAAHRERMETEGHGGVDWVFCDIDGGPLRKRALDRIVWVA